MILAGRGNRRGAKYSVGLGNALETVGEFTPTTPVAGTTLSLLPSRTGHQPARLDGPNRTTSTWDAAGNLQANLNRHAEGTTRTDDPGTPEHRIGAPGDHVTYAYVPVGNRLWLTEGAERTTSTRNVAHQLTHVQHHGGDRTTLEWDRSGNLLREQGPAGITTCAWDSENGLPQAARPTQTWDHTQK